MKKYGVRQKKTDTNKNPYVYIAEYEWVPRCIDEEKRFGTDNINEAFQFMAAYNMRDTEVFEKDNP